MPNPLFFLFKTKYFYENIIYIIGVSVSMHFCFSKRKN